MPYLHAAPVAVCAFLLVHTSVSYTVAPIGHFHITAVGLQRKLLVQSLLLPAPGSSPVARQAEAQQRRATDDYHNDCDGDACLGALTQPARRPAHLTSTLSRGMPALALCCPPSCTMSAGDNCICRSV